MRIFLALVLLALCCGCIRPARHTGGGTALEAPGLIEDALGIMLTVHPPAHTRLVLRQPADDAFGSRLTEGLRANGYAVAEYAKPAKRLGRTAPSPTDGFAFDYILDLSRNADELRITLRIGDESLNRFYRIEGDGADARFMPQGDWSRGQ